MDAVRRFHLELESLLKTEYHAYENSDWKDNGRL